MILKISEIGLVSAVICLLNGANGASFSKVFVHSGGSDVLPVEYYTYGAPGVVASPQIARLSAPPVGSVVPVQNVIPPCVSPCVVPGAAPIAQIPSANYITYNSPNVPAVVAPSKDNGYEYSYVVYDENTGDRKAQRELSDGAVVRGEYSFLQPDGYVREVQYRADDLTGFNVVVKRILPEAVGTERPCSNKNEQLKVEEHESHESEHASPEHEHESHEPEHAAPEHEHESHEPEHVPEAEEPTHEAVHVVGHIEVAEPEHEPVQEHEHEAEPVHEHEPEHTPEQEPEHTHESEHTHEPEPELAHEPEPEHVHEPEPEHEHEPEHHEPTHEQVVEIAHEPEHEPEHHEAAHDPEPEHEHAHEANHLAEEVHVQPIEVHHGAPATHEAMVEVVEAPHREPINPVIAYEEVLRCLQAKAQTQQGLNFSPLTYIILPASNRPC